jgi:hypothetical protein
MELTSDCVEKLEKALNKIRGSGHTLSEFCSDGVSYSKNDFEYLGQFGKTEFTDRVHGDHLEYQIAMADDKLWLIWGEDPEIDGNIWLLPIWMYI